MFLVAVFLGGAITDRLVPLEFLSKIVPDRENGSYLEQRVLSEESVVIEVAERVSPAVVTVSVSEERRLSDSFFLDPFGMFRIPESNETETVERDIGSGFIVSSEGLIVTNKHVVSSAGSAKYKVILKDGTEHAVQQIWRDPLNDLAILKVNASDLPVATMGDSGKLRVGQFVVAIGTALGEFRHTVTTGVISGLGRGITAGDWTSGYSERLDDVIQTDAAINPGNSGGPLLNSLGQVIGVNVAVSQGANNVGFALPINVIKDSLNTFNSTGQFERATLGVRYRMITRETAILNDVPAGAYIVEVVEGSAAERAGIEAGDIIVNFDGERVGEVEGGLAGLILKQKIGDKVKLEIYRDGETSEIEVSF